MQIIVEYVLLDNFMIDAFLLYLTNKIIRQPINKLGLVTASSFGAGFAVLSPLIPVGGILAILIKIFVAFIMVFMLNFTFYKLWLKLLLFVGLTFAFGGTLMAIFSFGGVSIYDSLYIGYVSSLPLGAIMVSGIVFMLFCIKVINSVFVTRKYNSKICQITVVTNGRESQLIGLVDSGNILHTSSGRSVIVINEETLKNWFSPFERTQIMLGNCAVLPNCEELKVSSMGGEYRIKAFDCKVYVCGQEKNGALGIAPNKICYGKCNAVVSNELLEV